MTLMVIDILFWILSAFTIYLTILGLIVLGGVFIAFPAATVYYFDKGIILSRSVFGVLKKEIPLQDIKQVSIIRNVSIRSPKEEFGLLDSQLASRALSSYSGGEVLLVKTHDGLNYVIGIRNKDRLIEKLKDYYPMVYSRE